MSWRALRTALLQKKDAARRCRGALDAWCRWPRSAPVNCSKCGVVLAQHSFTRWHCPQCHRVYAKGNDSTRENPTVKPTDELHWAEYILQDVHDPQVILNPCFKSSLKPLSRRPREISIQEGSSKPTTTYSGFADGTPPLLHFVWFGTPDSSRKLDTAFQWAPLLHNGWQGVCLWLDLDCFKKFASIWRATTDREKLVTLTGNPILVLGTAVCSGVSVYFASIDENVDWLSKEYDVKDKNLAKLKAAIDWERANQPPFQLVQVASDIVRVIILRYYGGAYFDFDIAPSPKCLSVGLLQPSNVPLGKGGFLCHRKGDLNENDIVFADPRRSCEKLDALLNDMVKFYCKPQARAELLQRLLLQHFPHDTNVVQKYLAGRKSDLKLLLKLAVVIEGCLERNTKETYLKLLDDDVIKLVGYLSETIQCATFEGFQLYYENDPQRWSCVVQFFSDDTLSKLFYSWKDPGVTPSLEIIESSIVIQAAVRGCLVRKEVTQRKDDAPQMEVIEHNDNTSISIRGSRRLYRFRGPTCAYCEQASYRFTDGTFYVTIEIDNERYVGITVVSGTARVFPQGQLSSVRTIANRRVFVHQDVLQPPFIEKC